MKNDLLVVLLGKNLGYPFKFEFQTVKVNFYRIIWLRGKWAVTVCLRRKQGKYKNATNYASMSYHSEFLTKDEMDHEVS